MLAPAPVELPFATVELIREGTAWPGEPILFVVDDRGAIIAGRTGDQVGGHWGTDPVFIAATRTIIQSFRSPR